jgi:CRISPR/Cas system CSM-associated protein Csm5 (group 7 of RAMP superfamily)
MYIECYNDTRQWLQVQRDIIKKEPNVNNVGFEVHTAVVIKRSIFFSPLKVNRQFIHDVITTIRSRLKRHHPVPSTSAFRHVNM